MKTDIIILIGGRTVALVQSSPETFDLCGSDEAVESLKTVLPVLEETNNPIGVAGDALCRLLYLGNGDDEQSPPPQPLKSHADMQDETLTENPIVLFQRRDPSRSEDEETVWITDRVFIDDFDAMNWMEPQMHRYPSDSNGIDWRIYVVPCDGSLKQIVKDARAISNA